MGTWPFDPNNLIGCFSDGSQQQVPNLDETDNENYYSISLLAKIDAGNYGYEITDATKAAPMKDFRTKLAQNIETYVKRPYCPTTSFANLRIDIGEKITSALPELQYAAGMKSAT